MYAFISGTAYAQLFVRPPNGAIYRGSPSCFRSWPAPLNDSAGGEISAMSFFVGQQSDEDREAGSELTKITLAAMSAIADENIQALKGLLEKLSKDHVLGTKEAEALKEIEELFVRFSSQQISIIKQSLMLSSETQASDLNETETDKVQDPQQEVSISATGTSYAAGLLTPDDGASVNKRHNASLKIGESQADYAKLLPSAAWREKNRNWSDSWKNAVKGVLQKARREKIRDMSFKKQSTASTNKVIPKSDATKERLRKILSTHFLLGDLDDALREEIIDAFGDLRVSAGTEVMKYGESADYFYVIDVGNVDIYAKKGNEPPTIVRSKGAGETFGELALMYDTVRNNTVKTTCETLIWAVDRPTFKSIIGRHLSGSQTAQALREAPALQKLSTREIVRISNQCIVQHYIRGQQILTAGTQMDKVFVIQEGQVRVSWGPGGGKIVGGGDTVAVMNRLEILGEIVLLNEEILNSWNYVASSEHVEMILMPRSVFDKDVLKTIRKGLQVQFISLALQRVPAFIELNPDQISNLADSFTESHHNKGQDIIKKGEAIGPSARLYVVQKGNVNCYRTPGERIRHGSSSEEGKAGWGQRLGSFLKGSTGTSASPSQSHISSESSSGTASNVVTPLLSKVPTVKGSKTADNPQLERRPSSSRFADCWNVHIYGVFGEECLQSGIKEEASSSFRQMTASVDVPAGVICLSVSLAKMISILGPIHEILMRVANLKVLRKVPSLEFLTNAEMDAALHSLGVRKLKPGDIIYRAGEPADRLYIVHKGTVVKTNKTKDGKVQEEILTEGCFFGENALDTNVPRSTTATAGETTGRSVELYYLDRAVLETNIGPLQELNETRRKETERKGIMKQITFHELEDMGLLGTGLFGKVKLVYSKRTEEYYALKCVRKAQVIKMHEEEHLRNEKINMSELDHPFITKLIRTFKDTKHVYLLQQLTVGRELYLFMERVGRLQEWEAAFYAGGVLLALEYMHNKGIVYRDLKPENTLIGENGYPILIDMGFAKRIHNRKTFSMCGTPDYMAPEIIKRQGHGKAVDFWALGCLIFEMITNTSPFNKGSDPPQVVFQKITEGNVRFPTYMTPNAQDICRQLLDPNPENRLGCRERGFAEIKEHSFFTSEIDFQLLLRQKEEAPMIPPRIDSFKDLCIPDVTKEDDFDHMEIVSTQDPYWDDIF
ncbi:hypothetical protein R1flu_018424 [Riccia fluitans]|uniref:cGMP-dependent protein kinase n=1 Tax=Riccia fluitans TaxID=41844 RepID=A0ABD1ZFT3_9MARC